MTTKEQRNIVKYMLDTCGKKLLGFPRGNYDRPGDFVNNYMFRDVGPSWACNTPVVLDEERLKRLKNEGMVCIGLVSILLRCVLKPGKRMPSLNPDNYGEYKDLKKGDQLQKGKRKYDYYKQVSDKTWKGDFGDSLAFGLNNTDEWLYIYTYGGKKGKVKPFSKDVPYPRGTLLFRCYDPYTQGHIAIVYTNYKPYDQTKVFHTIGDAVGENKVAIEPLSYSHEYFSRGKSFKNDWDKDDKYGSKIPIPYYTHVLLPEDYIDTDCFAVPLENMAQLKL